MSDQDTSVLIYGRGYPTPGFIPDLGLIEVVPHLAKIPKQRSLPDPGEESRSAQRS
jgi:hypothetical protein